MTNVATKTKPIVAGAAMVGEPPTRKMVGRSREHIYSPANLGARAADRITGFVGSWLFVGIHALWFGLWILLRIEPFPFGLLTLLVSLEAIFLSTFVMMSQNRQAERDHVRDDHEADEVDLLYQINQQQLEILQLLRTNLCPPPDSAAARDAAGRPTPATAKPQPKSSAQQTAPAGRGRSQQGRRQ